MHQKKTYIFFIFILMFTQLFQLQANTTNLGKIQFLLKNKDYRNAIKLYQKIIAQKIPLNNNSYLQLAFLNEKENKIPETLYYLNLYYQKNPSEKILLKIINLANKQNYQGYETNDFYLIFIFLKKYSHFLFLFLVLIGVYAVSTIFFNSKKGNNIKLRHIVSLLFYLIGCLAIYFLANQFKQGIVKQAHVNVRDNPSAAANIESELIMGQKLNIIGSDDVWQRIFLDKEIKYVHQSNLWILE